MDCIVHVVTKSWTQLSDFHFHSMGDRDVHDVTGNSKPASWGRFRSE